jgi:hypothetical protein
MIAEKEPRMKKSRFQPAFILFLMIPLSGCMTGWINRRTGITETREVQATGEAAQATILELIDTGMTLNNDPVVDLVLEVRRTGQPAYRARTRTPVSRLAVPRFQPGAVVPVKVDPRNPDRVALDVYAYKH